MDNPNNNGGARTIGENDAPNAHTQRTGIKPPAIATNNFEIKSSLITMIQNSRFHGLPMEDPLDHLDNFDMLCSTVKINGVTEDAFKLRLFPFSLGDKAHSWEKNVPTASVATWDACKKAFLTKFFSTSRTARIRNEISGFMQKGTESFGEAWERFKGYTLQCPHHGFSGESLLSTFYRGLAPKFRMMLDTASQGNFFSQTEVDGLQLVENHAQSHSAYGDDYDRSNRDVGDDSGFKKDLKSLEDKLDKFLLSQQGAVNFVSDVQEGYKPPQDTIQAELNYVGNQGYNQGYNNYHHNQTSFQPMPQFNNPSGFQQKQQFFNKPQGFSNPQAPQQQSQGSSSSSTAQEQTNQLLRQLLEGQGKSAIDFGVFKKDMSAKTDDLYAKIESIASHLKVLDNQVAQIASSSKRPMGQLPGSSQSTQKEYVNAISIIYHDAASANIVIEDNEKQVGGTIISIEDEEDLCDEVVVEKPSQEILVDSKGKRKTTSEASPPKPPVFEPSPYEPKLPFPGRFKKELIAKYRAQFEEKMKEVEKVMPNIEEFLANPQNNKFLKDAIKKKLKTLEGMVKLTHELDEQNEDLKEAIPKKLEDPGSFTLPCTLGPLKFEKSLCDLGASVSLMPLSVAHKLGHSSFKPCGISLILADRSIKIPVGLLEDVPVKIGDTKVLTDFVILDMKEEPKNPLILGRPFLATAGAKIDVKNGWIDLHLGNNCVKRYDIKASNGKPSFKGEEKEYKAQDGLTWKLVDKGGPTTPPDPSQD